MIENHSLVNELPELKDHIHELKINNRHFKSLFDQYHNVDKEIHRIEEGVEVSSDEYIEEKKKVRLNLKDELFKMLKVAESGATA
jgi:uncharacterized protein YdcH (DUF465 family)